ncbi:MAG: AAA family ATPase [Bacilli bacterium]|nr:AAA family ATPase [Bacilli bacterium]
MVAITNIGFGLIDEKGDEYHGDNVYGLLGFDEPPALPKARFQLDTKGHAPNETVVPKTTQEQVIENPRISSSVYLFMQRDGSDVRLNDGSPMFVDAANQLNRLQYFDPYSSRILYFPFCAENDKRINDIEYFVASKWFIVGAQLSSTGSIYSLLLAYKADPSFAFLASPWRQTYYSVMSNGYNAKVDGKVIPYDEIAQRLPLSVLETVPSLADVAEIKRKEKESEQKTIGPSKDPLLKNNAALTENITVGTPASLINEESKTGETINELAPATHDLAVEEPSVVTPRPETPITPTEQTKAPLDVPTFQKQANPEARTADKPESKVAEPELSPEEQFVKEQEATTSLLAKRHVYATRKYLKTIDDLKDKYKNELRDALGKIYQTLLTDNDEDLEQYLRIKRSTEINGLEDFNIYKFRVANSGTFQACRLFYTRGYDLKRHIEPNAIVLLYFSDTGEHDRQGKTARQIEEDEKKDESIIENDIINLHGRDPIIEKELYRITFQQSTDASKPKFSEYGVLSLDQAGLLEATKAPCAFGGSAGTGKTLMSIDLYRSLEETYPDQRILYLTYQYALKWKVEQQFQELDIPAECLTYQELAEQILDDGKTYFGQEKFTKWARSVYAMARNQKNNLLKIAPTIDEAISIAYVFYRGIIEGRSHQFSRNDASLLSSSDFKEEIKSEMGFDSTQKEKIYDIAKAYRVYVDRLSGRTDNMAAEELLAKKPACYDAIIVDETQDLTELQVLSICALLKEGSKKLYLFGDDNQAINPTIFTIESAASCLKMGLGPGIDVPIQNLRGAYRSSNFLVSYINEINRIKRKAIGAQGNGNDDDEQSLRKDEKGSLPRLITNEELEDELLSSPSTFQSDTIVIVVDDEAKKALCDQYPSILKDDVVTINDAKGREWDNVIIDNFLSSSRGLWDQMLSDERIGRKSTLHRMLFNRYYVALTRAKDRIIVLEDNVSPLIQSKLLHGLSLLEQKEEIPQYLNDTFTSEDWYSYARGSLLRKDFVNAHRCLNKIPKEKRDGRMEKLVRQLDLYDLFLDSPDKFAKEDIHAFSDLVDCMIEIQDQTHLKQLYSVRNADMKLRLLALDEKADPDYLQNVAQFIVRNPDKFTDGEQNYFVSLLLRYLKKNIESSLSRMESLKQTGGIYATR